VIIKLCAARATFVNGWLVDEGCAMVEAAGASVPRVLAKCHEISRRNFLNLSDALLPRGVQFSKVGQDRQVARKESPE
jgi:hypothetical protein